MKLLAVSTSSWSSANREFYRRLGQYGIDVMLVIPSIWNFGDKNLEAEPVEAIDPKITFLKPTNFHQRLYKLNGIRNVIKEVDPDIIYYEGDPGSLMSVLLGSISRKRKTRFYAISNENLSQSPFAVAKREGFSSFFSGLIKYSLIQYSKRLIECLFVINNEGLHYFKNMGFKKVVKIPLGFDENYFKLNSASRKIVRDKLGIGANKIVITYYGRLVYEKGLHLLIESLEKLDHQNFVFLIDKFSRYPDPYQKEVHNSIMKSSLKNKTIFFEARHLEIADYMNASDITVLPSISTKNWLEQYGRVVPEAKACGNLVIVSDVGAPKDFFESNYQFIFESKNSTDLRSKLQLAINELNSSNYNKVLESEVIKERYSLKAQVEVFKSILYDH